MRKSLVRLAALILTAICIILSSTELQAVETDGPISYIIEQENAVIIDCETSVYGDLTIPDTLGGCPVTKILEEAFAYCNFTRIYIPDGVTSIGDDAFRNSWYLSSISIPNSVTSIGCEAFRSCFYLNNITIPDGITSINALTFYDCRNLSNISLPDSLVEISWAAFEGCTGLTSIIIPNSVNTIGSSAFEGCTGLTSIIIPEGVKEIERRTFADCYNISSITIPSSITHISSDAFDGCYINDVYFNGSEKQWKSITIEDNNECLSKAKLHYAIDCSGNHTWDSGKVTKEATCKEEGVKTYTCTVCKETKTEAIAKLTTHTPGAEATATTPQICTVCGKELKPATGATEPPATEPPATEPPATEPPATEPTATEPTATEPPATEPPATEPPATEPTVIPTQPEGNKNPDDGKFPIMVVIAIVVLGGGGATAGVILWKKKH